MSTSQNRQTFFDYDGFVEKFKPIRTTDDCYTPPDIYEAVSKWAFHEYGIDAQRKIIRPFKPNGDYEKEEYPKGCIVLDNPPFSILSSIIAFYNKRAIDYFLFAPALTLFSYGKIANTIVIDESIRYENGAVVATGFVTNMGNSKITISGTLNEEIKKVQKERERKTLAKYEYPSTVINAAKLQRYAEGGKDIKIAADECYHLRSLDAQRKAGKSIYGSGFLISHKAARILLERNEALRNETPDYTWELSEREVEIIRRLDNGEPITELERINKRRPNVQGGEQMRLEI